VGCHRFVLFHPLDHPLVEPFLLAACEVGAPHQVDALIGYLVALPELEDSNRRATAERKDHPVSFGGHLA
jgi:hypothetical protein